MDGFTMAEGLSYGRKYTRPTVLYLSSQAVQVPRWVAGSTAKLTASLISRA